MDAAALQWRSSSWLDADDRKLTMSTAGVSVSPVPMCLWFTKGYSQTKEPFQVTKGTSMFGEGFQKWWRFIVKEE